MVIFYKKCKKYNRNSIDKKQNGLKYSKDYKSSTLAPSISQAKYNNNKHNMVIFYKKWKKYNKIQLKKKWT